MKPACSTYCETSQGVSSWERFFCVDSVPSAGVALTLVGRGAPNQAVGLEVVGDQI